VKSISTYLSICVVYGGKKGGGGGSSFEYSTV